MHPSPAPQFLALLQGTVEVETSDGDVIRFDPGDLILLGETSETGHLTFSVVPAPAADASGLHPGFSRIYIECWTDYCSCDSRYVFSLSPFCWQRLSLPAARTPRPLRGTSRWRRRRPRRLRPPGRMPRPRNSWPSSRGLTSSSTCTDRRPRSESSTTERAGSSTATGTSTPTM